MKKRNILIIALLVIGLGALVLVEGYVRPELKRREQRYLAEQRDPLTHDFDRLLKFKSPYMGDASNLANLNAGLPLNEIPRTFQLYPETLTAEINYQDSPAGVDKALFYRALVYNATANFALIDNLENLALNFREQSYAVNRFAVENWYGVDLAFLQNGDKWAEKVRRPLSDTDYVNSFIEKNFTIND